jgi:hypothetical protein
MFVKHLLKFVKTCTKNYQKIVKKFSKFCEKSCKKSFQKVSKKLSKINKEKNGTVTYKPRRLPRHQRARAHNSTPNSRQKIFM